MEYRGETISMSNPICAVYFTNIIQLPHQFMINLNFNYQGKGHILVYETLSHSYAFDLSVQKSFMKDVLTVELEGTDLFNSRRDYVMLRSGDYSIIQNNRYDTQEVVLTLRYKFNSAKSKYKGTGAGESAKSRM